MSNLFLSSEEIELECPDIYGISSSVKPYKLAWHIDRLPFFSSRMLDEIVNYTQDSHHSAYEITDLDNEATLYLVRNKGTNGYLYKKYKNFDFLLFSIAPSLNINNDSLTHIKRLDVVSLCTYLVSPPKPENMNFIQLL